jgi:hypothetical protein
LPASQPVASGAVVCDTGPDAVSDADADGGAAPSLADEPAHAVRTMRAGIMMVAAPAARVRWDMAFLLM